MPEPLERVMLESARLLREHPPQLRHPHKRALFELAYPAGVSPAGTVEVTRWPEHVAEPLSLADRCRIEIRPNYYDYRPTDQAAPAPEWHVNFADPRLFVAYGSRLFA